MSSWMFIYIILIYKSARIQIAKLNFGDSTKSQNDYHQAGDVFLKPSTASIDCSILSHDGFTFSFCRFSINFATTKWMTDQNLSDGFHASAAPPKTCASTWSCQEAANLCPIVHIHDFARSPQWLLWGEKRTPKRSVLHLKGRGHVDLQRDIISPCPALRSRLRRRTVLVFGHLCSVNPAPNYELNGWQVQC